MLILEKDSLKTVLGIWLLRVLKLSNISRNPAIQSLNTYVQIRKFGPMYLSRILDSRFTAEASFNLNSYMPPDSLLLPVQCIFRTEVYGAPLGHKAVPHLMLEQAMRCIMHRAAQTPSSIWKSKEVFPEERRTVIMNMPVAWNVSWWRYTYIG